MADAEEDDLKEYRWETGYEKTWEAIKEDETGRLDDMIAEIVRKARLKRKMEKAKQNCFGMMRHLYVVIDCSEAMMIQDLRPTRLVCTMKLLEIFVQEFFDQNPISQLGLIVLKKKRAEKLTEMTGTPRLHLKALKSLSHIPMVGEPSLQNGLDLAYKALKVMPAHASREILIIMGSLTTCDPININVIAGMLEAEHIRCSVISLSSEVHVCRQLTRRTNGTFAAVLNDSHFKDLLLAHVDPPPAAVTYETSLIKMGFPRSLVNDGQVPTLSMCMCHIENSNEPSKLSTFGYQCPQCYSKYCELPVECQVCRLLLVSAPHLARSYHHLFPVLPFKTLPFSGQTNVCYSCKSPFSLTDDKDIYQCNDCQQYFCFDCDTFIHEMLHSCVGCTSTQAIGAKLNSGKVSMASATAATAATQRFTPKSTAQH